MSLLCFVRVCHLFVHSLVHWVISIGRILSFVEEKKVTPKVIVYLLFRLNCQMESLCRSTTACSPPKKKKYVIKGSLLLVHELKELPNYILRIG